MAEKITTAEALNAPPVGSVVMAHWADGSQPDHYVVRTGSALGGAASGNWTLAGTLEWTALLTWGAELTLFSRPDALPAAPALPVPDGPKMLRETLCRAQSRVLFAVDAARLQALIDALDAMRPLGSDGQHGDRHTPLCGCESAPPASPATVEAAARVLEAHRPAPAVDPEDFFEIPRCICGVEFPPRSHPDRLEFRKHVAQALADAGLLRTPIPRALFSQALLDYRMAWHAADAAGREGERSREGLLAALTTVGVEVSDS